MTKVSMNPQKLKKDSESWIELETETINIVSNINNYLEQISNEAIRTPMIKKEFDSLVGIYKRIEDALTKNITLINDFFTEQFKKYDQLGTDSAEYAGTVIDGASPFANKVVESVEIRNTADNDVGILGKTNIKSRNLNENNTLIDNSNTESIREKLNSIIDKDKINGGKLDRNYVASTADLETGEKLPKLGNRIEGQPLQDIENLPPEIKERISGFEKNPSIKNVPDLEKLMPRQKVEAKTLPDVFDLETGKPKIEVKPLPGVIDLETGKPKITGKYTEF